MQVLTYTDMSQDDQRRYWPFLVIPDERDDPDRKQCWRWQGALNSKGYGQFKLCGRMIGGHRIAYVLAHPEISLKPSDFVLHSCDTPTCCNPRHLFLGTQLDNMHDMVAKGRQRGMVYAGGDSAREAQRRGVEARKARRSAMGLPYNNPRSR